MSEDQVRGKDGKNHTLTDREERVLADLAEGREVKDAGKDAHALLGLCRIGLIEPKQGWRLSPQGTQVATILAQRAAAMR
jgi:hypothetical protein